MATGYLACLLACLAAVHAQLTFNTCSDGIQVVLVDGVPLNPPNGLNKMGYHDIRVTIPAGAKVIGVIIINMRPGAGWNGYFSDGTVTDASQWKCTATPPSDDSWTTAGFDEKFWTTPAQTTLSPCTGYPAKAMWLRNDSTFNSPGMFFCRKRLVADPCASSPCQNGGECSKTSDTAFACTCAAGFVGATCTSFVGACSSSPCQHGGTCVPNGPNDFDCNCVPDWDDGDVCIVYQDPCQSSPCKNGATCNRLTSFTYSCQCTSAYIGTYCEIEEGTDPCSNTPCQHSSTCTTISKALGTYTCSCSKLYEGTMCEKLICISNPTTDCDLVGTNYGKYAYCSDCGSWAVCKATKRRTKSCKSRAPNLYFNRSTRNCTASWSSCTGLPGL